MSCLLVYATDELRELTLDSSIMLLPEVLAGISLYFDKALGNSLLYRFERAQYVEQTRRADESGDVESGDGGEKRGKRAMSEIYGAEHLLRLFGE